MTSNVTVCHYRTRWQRQNAGGDAKEIKQVRRYIVDAEGLQCQAVNQEETRTGTIARASHHSSRTIWEAAMSQFQLFDSVKLKEAIALTDGGTAPEGTPGAIVEVFNDGEAYMVELFGGWAKADIQGDFTPANRDESDSFMETIGVETVSPQQLRLVKPARETIGVRGQILAVLDNLSEDKLAKILDFAEFLQQKQQQNKVRQL